jgi:ABC-type transport system involved in cytochrome c biogenesis permease subunit
MAFQGAVVLYAVCFSVALLRPRWGRPVLALAVFSHLLSMVGRGWQVAYLPLSNKSESFSAAAVAIAICALLTWRSRRLRDLAMVALVLPLVATSWVFGLELTYPNPLLVTVWYPLHVPLSFLCFGLWAAASMDGLQWWTERDPRWLKRCDQLALQGFGLWSLSMVFGGIWGVVAWGAYFLWDPKVIWSVILWFHYASFVHLKLAPSTQARPWLRPALAQLGLVWVFVAYVGTSYFFGGSSHAF